MRVLVDTSVWSLALRKNSRPDDPTVKELFELIRELRVVMIGPIRQELLSGISAHEQFTALKERLQAFEDAPLSRSDYERAAGFYNICRKGGIQGSHIDFLICSVSAGSKIPIFTSDKDFLRYAKHLPISLYEPRKT